MHCRILRHKYRSHRHFHWQLWWHCPSLELAIHRCRWMEVIFDVYHEMPSATCCFPPNSPTPKYPRIFASPIGWLELLSSSNGCTDWGRGAAAVPGSNAHANRRTRSGTSRICRTVLPAGSRRCPQCTSDSIHLCTSPLGFFSSSSRFFWLPPSVS